MCIHGCCSHGPGRDAPSGSTTPSCPHPMLPARSSPTCTSNDTDSMLRLCARHMPVYSFCRHAELPCGRCTWLDMLLHIKTSRPIQDSGFQMPAVSVPGFEAMHPASSTGRQTDCRRCCSASRRMKALSSGIAPLGPRLRRPAAARPARVTRSASRSVAYASSSSCSS